MCRSPLGSRGASSKPSRNSTSPASRSPSCGGGSAPTPRHPASSSRATSRRASSSIARAASARCRGWETSPWTSCSGRATRPRSESSLPVASRRRPQLERRSGANAPGAPTTEPVRTGPTSSSRARACLPPAASPPTLQQSVASHGRRRNAFPATVLLATVCYKRTRAATNSSRCKRTRAGARGHGESAPLQPAHPSRCDPSLVANHPAWLRAQAVRRSSSPLWARRRIRGLPSLTISSRYTM